MRTLFFFSPICSREKATAVEISGCRRRHRGETGSERTEPMPLAPRTEALAASESGRAASEPQGAAVATEAEGLRLHLSSSNGTGYKGVSKEPSGRFKAQYSVGGKPVYLGLFGTAVEAAVAYARAVGEYQPPAPPTVATEAEGLQLHLSSSSATGYKSVYECFGRFQAKHRVDGREVHLGLFDTAVEGAVAYARVVGEAATATAAGEAGPSVTYARVVGRKRQQRRSSGRKRQRHCQRDVAGK